MRPEDLIIDEYGAAGYGIMHKSREVIMGSPMSEEELVFTVADELGTSQDLVRNVISELVFHEKVHERNGLIYEIVFKKKRYNKKFIPPTPEEIEQYALSKGHKVDGKFIYDYYNESDWKDRNNNLIKNWKLKVFSVWCKKDNKVDGSSLDDAFPD